MRRAILLLAAATGGCSDPGEQPIAPAPPTALTAEAGPSDEELAADAVLRFVLTDDRLADARAF
jgi:hypothetical protein